MLGLIFQVFDEWLSGQQTAFGSDFNLNFNQSFNYRLKEQKEKDKKSESRCELRLNERLCAQNQAVTLFHLAPVWMGSLSLAWFDIISCILSNNVMSKWEFENTMQI